MRFTCCHCPDLTPSCGCHCHCVCDGGDLPNFDHHPVCPNAEVTT